MPKIKTNRAAAKRFKKTATGQLKRNKAYKSQDVYKRQLVSQAVESFDEISAS